MTHTDEAVLDLFRDKSRCEYCGNVAKCQPHHFHARGMGGGSRLDVRVNLLALCHVCHGQAHAGYVLRCDLLAIIAAREQAQQGDIAEVLYFLAGLPKDADPAKEMKRWPLSKAGVALAKKTLKEMGVTDARQP